jgi:hypothetical protein
MEGVAANGLGARRGQPRPLLFYEQVYPAFWTIVARRTGWVR